MHNDFGDYKIDFSPLNSYNGTRYLVVVVPDIKKVKIDAELYEAMRGNKEWGKQFPKLSLDSSILKTLARSSMGNIAVLDPQDMPEFIRTGKKPFEEVEYMVKQTEGDARSDAFIKVFSLMLVYNEDSEKSSWQNFARRYMSSMIKENISSFMYAEENEDVVPRDIPEEITRAKEVWRRDKNFREYTLRFLDRVNNQTNMAETHHDLLSNIMAAVFLEEMTRPKLLSAMLDFFNEQHDKSYALSIQMPTHRKMIAQKADPFSIEQLKPRGN
jgi:hypothetical protein